MELPIWIMKCWYSLDLAARKACVLPKHGPLQESWAYLDTKADSRTSELLGHEVWGAVLSQVRARHVQATNQYYCKKKIGFNETRFIGLTLYRYHVLCGQRKHPRLGRSDIIGFFQEKG